MTDSLVISEQSRSRVVAGLWNGLCYIYPIAVVLLIWDLIAHSGMISRLLWPPVEQVAYELWRFAISGDMAFHRSITLQRALTGCVCAIAACIAVCTAPARL